LRNRLPASASSIDTQSGVPLTSIKHKLSSKPSVKRVRVSSPLRRNEDAQRTDKARKVDGRRVSAHFRPLLVRGKCDLLWPGGDVEGRRSRGWAKVGPIRNLRRTRSRGPASPTSPRTACTSSASPAQVLGDFWWNSGSPLHGARHARLHLGRMQLFIQHACHSRTLTTCSSSIMNAVVFPVTQLF
jgi:hypothetical protein